MKEIRNYKHIRKKPYIFGFTFTGATVFSLVGLFSILIILSVAMNLYGVIITFVWLFTLFIICRFFIGEKDWLAGLKNEKFPNEINDFTRKTKKK